MRAGRARSGRYRASSATASAESGTSRSARTRPARSSLSTGVSSTPPGSTRWSKLGTTEEWVIRNVAREQHPFHIHVNDFQVLSVDGKPYQARSLQDIVPLPVRGVVRIRMRFRNFLGAYVYHCHILAHEDAGMMGIVDVTRTGRRPSRRTLRALRDMRHTMGMAPHEDHPQP